MSSDTCKDDWIEARDKFKDKWFTEYGRQERIKKYIEEIRSNVLDMFGIDDRKCDTCEYWSHESDNREILSTCNPVVKAEIQPEIIHCKDCKHYKAYDYTGKLACHYVIGGTVEKKPDDFCSRAERLTNGIN